MPLMENMGIPFIKSLPLVADIIFEAGLKDRIRLVASGKLTTPAEVAWALCWRRLCHQRARVTVFSQLYPGNEMQQEYVPNGYHHAQ